MPPEPTTTTDATTTTEPTTTATMHTATGQMQDGAPVATTRRSLPARLAKGFAMFWWDFLVGDTPEFFVGVLVLVGIVLVLVKVASLDAVAIGLFPALVVVLLAGSVLRAKRSKH